MVDQGGSLISNSLLSLVMTYVYLQIIDRQMKAFMITVSSLGNLNNNIKLYDAPLWLNIRYSANYSVRHSTNGNS